MFLKKNYQSILKAFCRDRKFILELVQGQS